MEGLLFTGLFWGGILIIIGLTIILNAIFNIQIPIIRIIIAFILVYIGVKMLLGGYRISGKVDQNTMVFSEGVMKMNSVSRHNEYNVVFGKGTIDLSGVDLTEGSVNIEVNAVFGEAVIEIDPNTPVKITASAAFGSAVLPDESQTAFGSHTYRSDSYDKADSRLNIDATSVFGSLRVSRKKGM
jgi:predicted membrane protein